VAQGQLARPGAGGVVSLVAILAIQPALRVLADETNLLGVSKNLYFNKTADFATTGKWVLRNLLEPERHYGSAPGALPLPGQPSATRSGATATPTRFTSTPF